LGVTESSKREGAAGNEEGSSISNVGFLTGEEHNVAAHYEGCANDEKDIAAVGFPAEEREEDGEEGTDYLKRPKARFISDGDSDRKRQGDNKNVGVDLEGNRHEAHVSMGLSRPSFVIIRSFQNITMG
jgi:hypothetical protein